MTGYGKTLVAYKGKKIYVEVKSLNSKQLDLTTRVAPLYREKEMEIRQMIAERVVRGKVDFCVWVERDSADDAAAVNLALMDRYYRQLADFAATHQVGQTDWMALLTRMPDVLARTETEELDDEEWQAVRQGVREALERLVDFRTQEGAALERKFAEKVDNIERLLASIEPYEKTRVERIRSRIVEGLRQIPEAEYDKNRLEQELIYYIEKLDISEEKQRLTNHLRYFRETMDDQPGQGKKLGFIAQEMGREINTTGSKCSDSEIAKTVIAMKADGAMRDALTIFDQTVAFCGTDVKYSEYSFDITGATVAEGQCGLKLNLYSLDPGKTVGFCDIIIEGTLSGTEKDLPILASFKINATEYAADELFEADGTDMVGTFELSKTDTMVSESNPLTDITAASGEIGTVTYESTETSCKVTIPMTAGETAINYILNIVQKPDFTLTYIGLDGSTVGTQTVEKDAAIGSFDVDIESVRGAQEGYKARGWFKQDYVGEKYQTSTVITADTKLYAIETEIEVPSDSKKYTFDLTDQFFYDEDHEGFNSVGNGYWHDKQHGWAFQNGDKIELLVGKKASITLSLCQYSSETPINASNGATIENAKVETDGGMQSIEYEGEEGTLTLTFNGTAYVHSITVLNTTTTNYIREGNTFTVFAGDASSFLDALDAANAVPGTDLVTINLPNGTYDLGQKTLTTIGRDNITIKGESQDEVVIKNRPTAEGIGVTATLLNTSKYLMLENLTLKNDYPYYDPSTGKASSDAGRAVCLQDKGNYTVCKNVTMLSYQDTYYSNNSNGQFYFVDCEIHGLVDYVCGGGDVFFDKVLFYNESREMTEGVGDVTIAAPNGAKKYGYVMQNCTVDTHSRTFNWGRSWGAPSYLRWLNTTLKQPEKLATDRFTVKGMNSAADGFYEYNTMDESGNSISPASKVIKFTHSNGDKEYETIIDAEEAEKYTKEKVFEDAPELFKERIGYGTDGINAVKAAASQQGTEGIYNLAGQRVSQATKGIFIINGKKVIK